MSFVIAMNKPTKFKKILCLLCVLLMVLFCCVYVPTADAFAGAILPFLGEAAGALGLSVGTLGVGLLVCGVIAAGVYVATTYSDQIDALTASAGSTFTQFWNSLSSTQQNEFNSAGGSSTFDYASTSDQSFTSTSDTEKMTKEYMLENVFLTPHSDSVFPFNTDSTFPSLTDSYVSAYKALTFQNYFLVPTTTQINNGHLYNVVYSWVQSINGVWTKSAPQWIVDMSWNAWHDHAQDSNYYPAADAINIQENTNMTAPLMYLSQRHATNPYISLLLPSGLDIHKSIPQMISNYKQWAENYYPGISITAETWVTNPKILDIPFGNTVKVPAGTITMDGSQIKVKTNETVATAISTGTIAQPVATTGPTAVTITDTGTLTDPTTKVNNLKNLVTTKFPFSLPWDFTTLIGSIAATPIRPEIHINQNFVIMGTSMPFKIDVNFAFLDSWINYFRTFEILAFIGFLISATRRLLGGAQ
jgi:hypothetical protein